MMDVARGSIGMAKKVKIITVVNGKVIDDPEQAWRERASGSAGVQASRMIERAGRGYVRYPEDRTSIRRAVEAIERRIVEALWTMNRLPDRDSSFVYGKGRCGIDYMQDPNDRFSNAVANEGKWEEAPPRPAPPSSRSIDRMDDALDWLRFLAETQARLVTVAATTKRGDPERRVAWGRVREALPQVAGLTTRTLQRRYEEGFRKILSCLT